MRHRVDPFALTPREYEVVLLTVRGMQTKQIAHEIQVSQSAVEFHRTNIFQKLGVNSAQAMVSEAFIRGLVSVYQGENSDSFYQRCDRYRQILDAKYSKGVPEKSIANSIGMTYAALRCGLFRMRRNMINSTFLFLLFAISGGLLAQTVEFESGVKFIYPPNQVWGDGPTNTCVNCTAPVTSITTVIGTFADPLPVAVPGFGLVSVIAQETWAAYLGKDLKVDATVWPPAVLRMEIATVKLQAANTLRSIWEAPGIDVTKALEVWTNGKKQSASSYSFFRSAEGRTFVLTAAKAAGTVMEIKALQ